MAEATLEHRIRAEFEARAQRVRQSEEARLKEVQAREQRMAKFNEVCEDLKSVFLPRLDQFAKAFGETVKITPTITPAERAATVAFLTDLANITLTLRVVPNHEVTALVVQYDLLILPIYFEHERSSRLEMPLDSIDRNAVANWVDDRIISCVKAYLTVQDHEYYLRRATVEDPISKDRFSREGAAGVIEQDGRKLYFKTAETLEQYRTKHQIS